MGLIKAAIVKVTIKQYCVDETYPCACEPRKRCVFEPIYMTLYGQKGQETASITPYPSMHLPYRAVSSYKVLRLTFGVADELYLAH